MSISDTALCMYTCAPLRGIAVIRFSLKLRHCSIPYLSILEIQVPSDCEGPLDEHVRRHRISQNKALDKLNR